MKNIQYALLLLIALPIILSGCGGDGDRDTGFGSIHGYVYALEGSRAMIAQDSRAVPPGFEPVPGAAVTVTGATSGATTDADGHFRIDTISAGSQTVTITKDGYATVSFPVAVIADSLTLAGTRGGETMLGEKQWTIMVYMAADNDLEEFGILNMNQMEMIGSDANVNIIVQFDRKIGFDQTNGDWTGTRRYYVTPDNDMANINSTLVEDMGEQDMSDPDVLRDFVEWGIHSYPASRYVLVLWDHGSGWRSRQRQTRGILYDDFTNPVVGMSMAELNQALDVDITFDALAIDASLMQMLEVAYEIKDRAQYIVASEESPPGHGYPYQDFLGPLADNPSQSTLQFCRKIASSYVDANPSYPVTESVIDPTRLDTVATAVDALALYLRNHWTDNNRTMFDNVRAQSQDYATPDYKDLYHFASLLKQASSDAALDTLCDNVMVAIADADEGAVLYERHAGVSVANSHGVSIYIPSSGNYRSYYATSLQFCEDYPNWAWILSHLP